MNRMLSRGTRVLSELIPHFQTAVTGNVKRLPPPILQQVMVTIVMVLNFKSLGHPTRKFARAFVVGCSWMTGVHILNIAIVVRVVVGGIGGGGGLVAVVAVAVVVVTAMDVCVLARMRARCGSSLCYGRAVCFLYVRFEGRGCSYVTLLMALCCACSTPISVDSVHAACDFDGI